VPACTRTGAEGEVITTADIEKGTPASTEAMRRFWDDKARENAMWFVSSKLDYADTDADAFWRSGDEVVDRSLGMFGLSFNGSERVLDIGCGVGRLTRALSTRAASVVGIDVSDEMVKQAREAVADLGNVDIQLGNGTDLAGLPDSSFDAAFSFVVFQHIPDPAVTCTYVREIGRVLRPGGWAVFQVSEAPEIHRVETWRHVHTMRRRVQEKLGRAPRGTLEPQWLGSAVPRADLLAALNDGGLELRKTVGDGTQYCMVHVQRI
jgi:ubiquinone/menaquinone biosynthesis C-methylase UbiE